MAMNPAEIELHLVGGWELAQALGVPYLENESAEGNPCCAECAATSRAKAEEEAQNLGGFGDGWGRCTKCGDGTLCCRGKVCDCRQTPAGASCGCIDWTSL